MDMLGRHTQEAAAENRGDGAFHLAARWVEVACSETSAERQHMEDEYQGQDDASTHA